MSNITPTLSLISLPYRVPCTKNPLITLSLYSLLLKIIIAGTITARANVGLSTSVSPSLVIHVDSLHWVLVGGRAHPSGLEPTNILYKYTR